MLGRAHALGGRGLYVLQAAIASLHLDEPQDWPQLPALYGELAHRTGSSVVELNQGQPRSTEAGDVEAALALTERLELEHYHYLHATRAELRRVSRIAYPTGDRAVPVRRRRAGRSGLELPRQAAANYG